MDILRFASVVLAVFALSSAFVFISAVAAEQGSVDDWLSKATRFLGGVTGYQVSGGGDAGSGGGAGGGDGGVVSPDYCKLLTDKANAAFGTACGDVKYDYVADVNSDMLVNIRDISSIVNMDTPLCKAKYLEAKNPCEAAGSPDIAAQSLSYTPGQPKAGEEVKFTAIFVNKGAAATNDLSVGNSYECVSGGSASGGLPAAIVVKPGETYTYTFSHKFGQAEECTVSASASTTGDPDTSNNKATAAVKVISPQGSPDIAVTEISLFPPFPKAGDTVKFSAAVKNIGNAVASDVSAANGITCAFAGGGSTTGTTPKGGITIQPGGSYTYTFSQKLDSAAECSVSVSASVADDANHYNNKLTKPFNVSAASPDQPSCSDSDGGMNYYVKGTTIGLAADGVMTTRADSCRPPNSYGDGYDYVAEWFCGPSSGDGKTYAVNTNEKCLSGCKDGACVKQAPPPAGAESFKKASWQCYDGSGDAQSSDACASSESWRLIAEVYCKGRCSSVSGKCGVNSFSVHDTCSSARNFAPVIVSSEVPSSVQAGAPSTFAWRAEDADGDTLAWSVEWGDGSGEAQACAVREIKPKPMQTASTTVTSAVQGNAMATASSGSSSGSSGGGGVGGGLGKDSWAYKTTHTFSKPGQYKMKVSVDECGSGKSSGIATASYLVSVAGTGVADDGCSDSDGGIDYYKKGFMKAGLSDSGQYDACINSNELVEYYCTPESREKATYSCPSGCSDGACIMKKSVPEPIRPAVKPVPTPVPVPEEWFKASLKLEKGWNLVGISTLDKAEIRENTCSDKDVLTAYGYDSSARKYFSIAASKSPSLDKVSGVWLKMAGQCSVAYTIPQPHGWIDGRKLAKGWNLLSVVPDMAGRAIDDFAGSCKVTRAFGWNAAGKNWENIERTELPSSAVGSGFAVQVANDCILGVANAVPPPLPPEAAT